MHGGTCSSGASYHINNRSRPRSGIFRRLALRRNTTRVILGPPLRAGGRDAARIAEPADGAPAKAAGGQKLDTICVNILKTCVLVHGGTCSSGTSYHINNRSRPRSGIFRRLALRRNTTRVILGPPLRAGGRDAARIAEPADGAPAKAAGGQKLDTICVNILKTCILHAPFTPSYRSGHQAPFIVQKHHSVSGTNCSDLPKKKCLRRGGLKTNFDYGETDPTFFSLRRKGGRTCFSPAAEIGGAPKNGGTASRTLTPAHVRQAELSPKMCASAPPHVFEYNPGH